MCVSLFVQFTVERVMGYECYSIVTNVKSEEKRVSITATDLIRHWQFLRPVPLSLGVKVFLDRDTVAFVQPPSLNNNDGDVVLIPSNVGKFFLELNNSKGLYQS